jgi:hypothetical protein
MKEKNPKKNKKRKVIKLKKGRIKTPENLKYKINQKIK